MPLAAVVSGANATEGQQVAAVFGALVVTPPEPLVAQAEPDPRDLPSGRGDGAYGNAPTREAAATCGFRMRAPKQGQTRLPGIGRVRSAVERGHALLSQFGRVARRFDRSAALYLAWVQMAACIIFIRAGFVA